MVIQTTRFGQVEIEEQDTLNFPEGVLGFQDLKKFVLLNDPTDDIFAWLQSCEAPEIAFPVLEPELFAESFNIQLSKADYEHLKMTDMKGSKTFCIVTIPEDPTKMTANMKAPVIINLGQKIARQCVLQDNSLAIREPIFAKLQQRVVQYPDQPIKSDEALADVAIRLPEAPMSEADREL